MSRASVHRLVAALFFTALLTGGATSTAQADSGAVIGWDSVGVATEGHFLAQDSAPGEVNVIGWD
ncbi:hypothetical protein ACIO3O_10080 [Streptomyces sp. NPDC087440]|uniref:hypothetical protein n=1 Tax=Streptomyces sp. NPDC087440 TaxID=3365790 RepID=UPI00381FBA35